MNDAEKLEKLTAAAEKLLREPALAVLCQSRWKLWLLGLLFPSVAGALQIIDRTVLKLQRVIGEIT